MQQMFVLCILSSCGNSLNFCLAPVHVYLKWLNDKKWSWSHKTTLLLCSNQGVSSMSFLKDSSNRVSILYKNLLWQFDLGSLVGPYKILDSGAKLLVLKGVM